MRGRIKSLQSVIFLTGTSKWLSVSGFAVPRRQLSSHAMKCDDEAVVQDMLYRIRQVNSMPQEVESKLLDFWVDGSRLGEVTPSTADILVNVFPDNPIFEYKTSTKKYLSLSEAAGDTCESRTNAVQRVMQVLRSRGLVVGWRDELYPISHGFYRDPVFHMERAATPLLGTIDYGVHINGLVFEGDKPLMWMARRAPTKSKHPNMLDHIVAGGQPVGISLMDNVVKECTEEAGIPEDLTRAGICPAGAVSYRTYVPSKDAVSRAVLFCYDLVLPSDFQPVPTDGEVEEFFLWDMDQVKASLARDYPDPIKPNCYPVIIDCLLRRGFVSPEAPGYLDVIRELRSGDCY